MPCKAVNKAASLPSKVRMTIGIGELVVKAKFGCLLSWANLVVL